MPSHVVDFIRLLNEIRYNLKYFGFYKLYLRYDLYCVWKESHINMKQPEFSGWLGMSEFPWGDRNVFERASTHSNPWYMEHESLRPVFVYTWKDKILFQRGKKSQPSESFWSSNQQFDELTQNESETYGLSFSSQTHAFKRKGELWKCVLNFLKPEMFEK